jgi:hypothetical protein
MAATNPLTEIRAQRARLVEIAANERESFGRQTHSLVASIGLLDRGFAAMRSLASRPELLAAAAAIALIVLRPRRILRWVGRALFLWRAWRAASGLLKEARNSLSS